MPVENLPVDIDAFRRTLRGLTPPPGLVPALEALWWEAKGDWTKAHEIAQAHEGDAACDWVHAYLHRVEGDLANAKYWYRQAGKPAETGDMKDEWAATVAALLSRR